MGTKTNFFDKMEQNDLQMFEKFNEDVNFFESYTGQPKYSRIDVMATSIRNDACAVELKFRAKPIYYFMDKGVFIEPSKYEALYTEFAMKGKKALYLNFFEDGTACLWKIDDEMKFDTTQVRIWNEGKKTNEFVDRILLTVESACATFKKNDEGRWEVLKKKKTNT